MSMFTLRCPRLRQANEGREMSFVSGRMGLQGICLPFSFLHVLGPVTGFKTKIRTRGRDLPPGHFQICH